MDVAVVDPALFAGTAPPRLAGSRCPGCATVTFPRRGSCPRCPSGTMAAHTLPERGVVWSWTVQEFEPKPPYRRLGEAFVPYAVGYVDLGVVIVESRLDVPRERLRIGLPVRLTMIPAFLGEDGTEVHTFAFSADEDGEIW
ncbi:Zn-ribbon domain-containing OB-fold protein [Actinomadura rudentiformis]|uniref:DNA-binding protein n=1 Tax=Actinomadura rudentiformis TaxID=359158 RepID=A0A6H9YFH8_9ACTN|nr:OB-fold domain-containing protein [Actinomadura rudentiformis]KAB2340389.1 hypothetical protein F8566_45195 [Actinomadura rudentiformis]